MWRLRAGVVGIGICLCSSLALAGEPVFDNVSSNGGVNLTGAAPAAQWDETMPFRSGAADDFTLPPSSLCTWQLDRVTWTGQYWGGSTSGVITGFRILIWPDADGMPAGGGALIPDDAQVLASYSISGNAGETPSAAGTGFYDYTADLSPPIELPAGTRFWVEIRALAAYPPQWGVAVTQQRAGASPYHYFDLLDLRAWMPIADAGDLAFVLYASPATIDCDDGNACTTDSCDGTTCVHEPVTCDDGSACTTDTCDPAGGCQFTPISCDDGNACTTDSCDATLGCQHEGITCDDGDPCTIDSCDAQGGCTHEPMTCDDQSACTTDTCVAGACVFTPISCDDGNACTEDSCDAAGGCSHQPISCDDGNACTTDSCDPATGCAHEPLTCDDQDACTTDTCDPGRGCVFTPITCDDGNACTADTCVDGVCESGAQADFDGSGVVGAGDYQMMFACMQSSTLGAVGDGCACMDLNGDGQINLVDYGLFQCSFAGSN